MRVLTTIALVLLSSSLISCSKQQAFHPTAKDKSLCLAEGGSLTTKKRGDQSVYDVCIYEENRQCELEALTRGLCIKGGFKVTGDFTAAARYCSITGGRYEIVSNSNTPQETGTCSRNGRTCDAGEYFNNHCKLP